MILSVGFEPILENKYFIKGLHYGLENKVEKATYAIGGQGINLARILKNHGIDVFATGFLGGASGNYIYEELRKRKIYNDFILVKDESRKMITIVEKNNIKTSIIEDGPRITREDLASFYGLYKNIVNNFNIACGLGPIIPGLDTGIYYDLIKLSRERNKRFILDTEGEGLSYGIEAMPFMVKLDRKSLEDLTKIKINFQGEAVRLAKGLIESGIELVVVDLDKDGSIVLNQEMGHRLDYPGIKDISLGKDQGYTSAGYAFGLEKSYDFETTMRLAYSFRLAYGEEDIERLDMADIKKIMGKIEISPIYY